MRQEPHSPAGTRKKATSVYLGTEPNGEAGP